MNTKTISFILFALVWIPNACSPAAKAPPSEELPAPVAAGEGYRTLEVDDVHVEMGVDSPIPVHVNVSGSLPDTCAQLKYSEIRQDGSTFNIQLSTIPGPAGVCINDSLPFVVSIPINTIDLPAGDYSVDVNGIRGDFRLENGGSVGSLRTGDIPVVQDDVQVNSVDIQMGVGSPIPVKAIVSGDLPIACAQLGEVRLHRDGTTFFVRLVADLPAQTDCSEDSIPFRLEIPLNIVNLPEGPYVVNVNGVTASFDPHTIPASP